MKRVLIGLLTAIIVVSTGTIGALAAGPGSGYGRNFVDADGNGVCDFAGESCHYADADWDGVRDHCGVCRNGCGHYFVDSDDDGFA